jgi:ubiquinone/menaquinone biosynthesis C-methylase UbiE
VQRDWPLDAASPKGAVLARRLAKARARPVLWKREVDMLVKMIGDRAGQAAAVLEVACGTGLTLLELADRGFRVTGLEFDPELCRLTDRAAKHFSLDAHSVAGDACKLPFADGSFDAVYSRSFFEHVYHCDHALSEQIRILRTGGFLIISDGNLWNPRLLLDLLFLYPIRTRGKHGGLKWLLQKRKVHRNLYGYLTLGRDEDVKTVRWWRRTLGRRPDLRVIEATTSAKYLRPEWPRWTHPFIGACQLFALKVK